MTKPLHASATPTYQKLPIGEKRALDLANARERGVRCPWCDVETSPRDLLAHVEKRCPGPQEAPAVAWWLTPRDARALGFRRSTLLRLAAEGIVRTRGIPQKREYLGRDLVLVLVWRKRLAYTPTPGTSGPSAAAPHAGGEARGISLPLGDRIV